MDFAYSEEQELLRNSVARFLADNYSFEIFRNVSRSEPGWRRGMWKQFAELGLLGASIPESFGGLGGGSVETMIVMEAFGRALVIEPYVPTVVIAGGLLRAGGGEAQKREWLPRIASGDALFALAFAEPQARYNLADVSTTAKKRGDSYVLNGQKAVVIGAPFADALIVTARTAGERRDADGISVFVVDARAGSVARRDYPTVDGLRASEISFENADVPAENLIGTPDEALPLVEQAIDEAIAAHCAEALGAMRVMQETTVEYAKTRKQFGVPIGKFQVLQHRMVDMFVQVEQSASMTLMVTLKLGESAAERKKAASAAKVQIGKAGRFVGQSAVQIHGGIGMTDELALGHYFKRLTMIDALYGNVDHHLARYASLTRKA
ncbi:MAG TPA: acyl-CoA dehydrogenase family protein [Rhizomicrobium sp.]|jgi:pimeloyl-CoA dehydrogenase small subunit|nr:acyl-CoA dehydrogenase family protein [Rhizomicrobium sp.]